MSSKRQRGRKKPADVSTPPWDQGATGPANRHRLREEPATEIDPETGRETPNPNNVKRMRRVSWVDIYSRSGRLSRHHVAAAEMLRMAAEGMQDRDPLAAISGVRNSGGFDAQSARVDARKFFRELWSQIPKASRPVIERVVIEDRPVWKVNEDRHIERLRLGLEAI